MICMLHRLVHLVVISWFGYLPPTKGFKSKVITLINTRAAHTLNFPWKCVWRGISPPSTHICLGGKTGKILMANNLCKKGIVITGWCCTCKLSGETSSNLLSHCSIAYDLWVFFSSVPSGLLGSCQIQSSL